MAVLSLPFYAIFFCHILHKSVSHYIHIALLSVATVVSEIKGTDHSIAVLVFNAVCTGDCVNAC